MHLANHAYRVSRSFIDWDHRFHAELYVLARPDHAGINGARGLTALSTVQRRLKGKFYEGNKSVERSAQSDVLYLFLQIDERVLQRETILQHVWIPLNFTIAIARAGAGWNGNANHAGYGSGSQQGESVRQITQAFAEEKCRYPSAETIRVHALLPCSADFNFCTERENCLMLGAREELVLCAEFEISKSARFVLVLWIQVHEFFAQLDAEIWCN